MKFLSAGTKSLFHSVSFGSEGLQVNENLSQLLFQTRIVFLKLDQQMNRITYVAVLHKQV